MIKFDVLRPLGALEKNFWLTDQISSTHFVSTAEIRGFTTIQQWRASLDAIQRRHSLFLLLLKQMAISYFFPDILKFFNRKISYSRFG
jgi:hypothetical protein